MEVEFVKERDYTNFASNSPPFWWKGELGSYPGHSIRTVQARPGNWANEMVAPPKFQSRALVFDPLLLGHSHCLNLMELYLSWIQYRQPPATQTRRTNLFVVFFLFVELNGDPCQGVLTFCISNKDSVIPRLVYLRSIQESRRQPPPPREGRAICPCRYSPPF